MYGEFRFKEANKYTVEHSVYVNNDFQGKGIGKIVLQELIVLAKKQGYTMIGVIDAENQSSVVFHEKFGFKTVGTIKILLLNLTVGCILFLCSDFRIKKAIFTNENRFLNFKTMLLSNR
jgi:GNAT superfamily N-acetyltransferase